MDQEHLLTFTADIISAHVSNNNVAATDLPSLIQSVFHSLNSLGAPEPEVDEAPVPAVSVRASVKPHAITCLVCGQKLKMLKRHLAADHNLTPAEYRAMYKLPADYPLVASDYAAKRKELALQIGLGRKPREEKAPKKATAADGGGKAAAAKAGGEKAAGEKTGATKRAPRKTLKPAFES